MQYQSIKWSATFWKMKNIIAIFILIFSVTIPSTSFSEWTELSRSVNGDTFYLDYKRIRQHDGYVSYWTLSDFLIPTKWGDFSTETYRQGDCNSFRFRNLRFVQYKKNMAQGPGDVYQPKNIKWNYPRSDSLNESILKIVCSQ